MVSVDRAGGVRELRLACHSERSEESLKLLSSKGINKRLVYWESFDCVSG